MFEGRFVFAQVTEFVPWYEFDKFVAKYKGNYRAHGFNCKGQFLHLLFGQLTACSSLRDICLCLAAHENCVYHLGFRKTVDPSTLSRANERRDYRIWEDLGYYLIGLVRPLYRKEKIDNIGVDNQLFALDSTSISISIKLATWALGKYSKGAVKMHTLLDLRGSIPTQIFITDGRHHDGPVLEDIDYYVNAIYTADKAYTDFKALFRIHSFGAWFVMRPKCNMKYEVVRILDDDGNASNICGDCVIILTGNTTKHLYPDELRMVRTRDPETGEIIDFITNNFELSAQDVASIYRHRWDIEVFFKWIKQNIVIKTLWGYSENAVRTHLWVAICTYLILARIKKELKSRYSITEIATLVSVSALEKHELKELLMTPQEKLLRSNQNQHVKVLQLELFN